MKEVSDIKNNNPSETECSKKVMQSLKDCTPRSSRYFLFQKIGLWIAGFAVILPGGFALATLFRRYHMMGMRNYSITHESFLHFFIDTVPMPWIALVVMFVTIAIFRIKCVPHMYKLKQIFVVFLVLLLTLVFGQVLYTTSFVQRLDNKVARIVPGYHSVATEITARWMHPQNGRIIGNLTESTLIDPAGNEWEIDTSQILSMTQTCENGAVKAVGYIPKTEQSEESEVKIFVACEIFDANDACTIMPMKEKGGEMENMVQEKAGHFSNPMYAQMRQGLQEEGCDFLKKSDQ